MKKEKKRRKQEPKRPRQNQSSRQTRGLRATLVEASPDALIALDAEGTILYWSAGAEAVYGFAKGEALGVRLQNLVTPPEFVAEGEQIIRDAIEHGLAVHEAVHRKKDGSAIYVDITAKTVRDKTGNIEFVAVSHKDVTQLKVLNHGKILEARYRGLLESVPDAIVMVNNTGRIVLVNGQAEELFGYTKAELLGKPIEILLPQRFREGHVGHRTQYFSEPKTRTMGAGLELFACRQDGAEFPVEICLSPLRTEEGTFAMSAIRDITTQKQASQYVRSLIEASLDPLVTVSPEGKIMDVNEAAVKVTGVTRDNLIGTDFWNYFTEPEKAREAYQQAFARGFVTDYPLTIRHTEGRLSHVLYNASVYKDASGKVLGVVAAARDVSPLRKAEVELAEQRSRELERLAELERFQKLTVGRELKMIELKKEVADLTRRLAERAVSA